MNGRFVSAFLGLCLVLAATGCPQSTSKVAPAEAPTVPVSVPAEREVTDYVDFTGRTDAVESVDVRPRVTGYLIGLPFKEGAEVKKGDLLFEVDPRPYQAQLDQALAQVDLNEASYKLARTNYERDLYLAEKDAVSPKQLDTDRAAVDEAKARIKAAQASTEVYKLNLAFCKVTSPIDGQVSRYYLTIGNLVNQDQTLLTSVVSLDPMYAYFDMDEPTLLRIKRAVNEGKIKPSAKESDVPVLMGLQGEDGYQHKGYFNFINNQINPTTGSISVRGVFENKKPKGGTRLLVPGMFVRIRLPIGQPHTALLVIDRAIASDQGLKYLYVVDKDNKVQYRRIKTGALQEDGLRVIEEGVNADERVVVGALQQLRPRMQIQPEVIPMPTLGQPAAVKPPPPAKKGKGKGK
jgi:multidrug efflux system membrane fusion protein